MHDRGWRKCRASRPETTSPVDDAVGGGRAYGQAPKLRTRMAVPDVSNYMYKGSIGLTGRTKTSVGPSEG